MDRFGESDRALFPEVERRMKDGKSVQAAARELAAEKRIKGNATEESLAMRLARLYRKEHGGSR